MVLFVLAIIGVVTTGAAIHRLRADPMRQLLLVAPSSPQTVRDGEDVVIRGTVALAEPGADLSSPISRRQCVMWMVTFDELGIGGDYRELGRMEQGRTFLVTTPSGTVRVVPEHSRIQVAGAVSLYAMVDLVTGPRDNAIRLARTCCKPANYLHGSSLRVTEYLVVPGMDIAVRGHFTREPDPGASADVSSYRGELPSRPVLSGTRAMPLLVRDYRRTVETGQ